MSYEDARIHRFSLYKTRCNLCGKKHDKPSHMHFFQHDGKELHCCESCLRQPPSNITRKEYWDRIYEEPDAGHPLWRYMDLPKFLDLILFKRLWFSQVAKLDDSFEGALGLKERQEDWRRHYLTFLTHAIKNPPKEYKQELCEEQINSTAQKILRDLEVSTSSRKTETFVNCWHMAKHESFLMWKVYAKDRPESVCIKSNLRRIYNSLGNNFRIGVVKYIDFKTSFPDIYWPFLFKRAAFLQESEVRLFTSGRKPQSGIYTDVDPYELIDEIIVSPEAPEWLTANLQRLIELTEFRIPIRQSDLNQEPF